MFREILLLEWERRRATLLLITAFYAVVPLLFLAELQPDEASFPARGLLSASAWSFLLVAALCVAALAWGAGGWRDERRGGWRYLLALPVDGRRIFLLRYLAGLVWLAVPLLLLGTVSLVAAAIASPPPGVYAYPGAFWGWVALASSLLYTVTFVLAARFAHPWIVLLGAAAAYLVLYVLLVLGSFPLPARLAEAVTWGAASPLGLLFDAPYLFDH